MARPKPAQPEIINELIKRVDKLIELGVITGDFVINTDEACAITGLAAETIRRYGRERHIPSITYPGKNMYPLKEICEFVQSHYNKAEVFNTSEMNNYKGVRRGRSQIGRKRF